MAEEYDVIIVGAGVSGLSAAYRLWSQDSSLRVLVLEGNDRIGGRTCRGELQGVKGRDTWDIGGQWVSKSQPHIMSLLTELGLNTRDQYTIGKKVMQLGDNKIRTYKHTIPSLPWYALLDLHLFMTKAKKWIKNIDPNDPFSSPNAEWLDSTTFDEIKNTMLWTTAARETVDIANRCIFGLEPSQMSALYYLMYAAAAGGLDPLISAEKDIGGGQEMTIQEGAWSVSQRLHDKIGTDTVHLKEPVTSIQQDDTGVTVHTMGGTSYICDRVILALPPHQQTKIQYSPSLPIDKLHVIHRMTVGNVTKVLVTYKKTFWRSAGFSGEGVTAGGSSIIEGLEHGPLSIIMDATSSRGNPAIVGFIGGQQQVQYGMLTQEARKRAVLHNLSELFGRDALDPIDYLEKDWNKESYSDGGPVSVATPGILRNIAAGLREPVGRLHFAGTESATVWCGFINGAVQAGYRAAHEVLYNIRPQVIRAPDLEGTFYDKKAARHPRQQYKSRVSSLLMPLSLVLGLVVGGLYFTNKRPPLPKFISKLL